MRTDRVIQLTINSTEIVPQPYRVYSVNGIAPTLTIMRGGREPKILEPKNNEGEKKDSKGENQCSPSIAQI
jgi:hypothetical protein